MQPCENVQLICLGVLYKLAVGLHNFILQASVAHDIRKLLCGSVGGEGADIVVQIVDLFQAPRDCAKPCLGPKVVQLQDFAEFCELRIAHDVDLDIAVPGLERAAGRGRRLARAGAVAGQQPHSLNGGGAFHQADLNLAPAAMVPPGIKRTRQRLRCIQTRRHVEIADRRVVRDAIHTRIFGHEPAERLQHRVHRRAVAHGAGLAVARD